MSLAVLFGSAAGGRWHDTSDVDIGIVPHDDQLPLHDELALQSRLEQACGRAVDLVRLDRATTVLRWQVARHGLVLLANPPRAAARFLAEAASEYGDVAPALDHASRVFARRLARLAPRSPGQEEPLP